MNTQTRHINEVIERTSRHAEGLADDDIITRSWARCVSDHGLDPSRTQPARVLEAARLREHQDQLESFLRVARAGMEQLYKRVSPLGYVLLLTDAQGVAVDCIGNDQWDRDLKRSGLCLGADWQESHSGTSGVGTCIVERVPVTCHQTDHFDATHIGLTCTAAPLFDPTGEFIGVLDISALTSPSEKTSQHLAGHMTTMFAQMVEDANFVRYFSDKWILRLSVDWALVDISGNCMLAFDADGVIVGANSVARKILAAMSADGLFVPIVGHLLSDVFKGGMDQIWEIARSASSTDRAVLSTHRLELFYAAARPPRNQPSRSMRSDLRALESPHIACPALDRLAGSDSQMQRLIDQSKRLVNKKVNILLHGETGTGKEVVARALHDSSTRAGKPFIAVNCASIPESLIESELFGYVAGSFTGGRSKGARGLIQQSDGGTLFLDEIGDMPLLLQTRLLRVLAEQEVMPLGAEKPIPVQLSVVAASHRDLRRLIAEGVFREDLYYRLCGASLLLPPLRLRADKTFVISRVLEQETEQIDHDVQIDDEALELLLNYSWPGNIRQLRNVIRFAVAISDSGHIEAAHLPQELYDDCERDLHEAKPQRAATPLSSVSISSADESFGSNDSSAAETLNAALRKHRWNITAVSHELGICRATVYRQMKRLNIVSPTHQ
ncbi:MAG: sigma-54-dependent Fis family transcriptional regulator [Dechloromonas sp.]|uniref:sigma-54-dependent Fis family transcriptional regulator n=1 Tax=Azonexaceae TaxID=2008795 RepID=UPI001CF90B6B|nr:MULTISPECIES: sigma-54-dependent Fis family transcriptional regulator [Azonexaceae]MBT9521286.1 sigma-54-dependent Fis family transcriptional regulator [Dechloromonas sp.]UCV21694.1 sigma-54-dependent Fis family transcriptional regulator [Ferribacterium limneticum]